MQPFYYIFIVAVLMMSIFLNTDIIYVDAVEGGKTVLDYPNPHILPLFRQKSEQGEFSPKANLPLAEEGVTTKSAVIADAGTGEILYAKNMAAKIPLASITKLMSFSVLAEKNLNWDEVVSLEDSDIGNLKDYVRPGDRMSLLGLGAGSKIKLRDLIYAALVKSANDAMAAAVRAAGFLSLRDPGEGDNFFAFAKEMNDRALELGMFSTEFDEPTGLSINNVTTARDLVLLARSVFENKIVQEITSQRAYIIKTSDVLGTSDVNTLQFDSTNKLFKKLEGTPYKIIGGKTGFVEESGYNLLVEVENKDGRKYIIVILGATSDEGRFEDAYKLLIFADGQK